MKAQTKRFLIALSTLALAACSDQETEKSTTLNTTQDKQTYAFGAKVGSHVSALLKQGDENGINKELLKAGLVDAIDNNIALPLEEINEFAKVFTDSIHEQEKAKLKDLEQKNLTKSESFLETNKKDTEVVTTTTGLQYKIIKTSAGPKPGPNSVVRVAYEGRLIDGTIIDKREESSNDVLFMERVIPGWHEGLQLMSVGSEYTFYIHPDLAYKNIRTASVAPNSALIFDIKLVEIIKQ